MRLSTRETLLSSGACAAAVVAGYLAYGALGWMGVGVLGLLIASIAFRLELEQDAPVGHEEDTTLFSSTMRARERMSRAERTADRINTASRVRSGKLAKAIGAVLAIVGFGGLVLSELFWR